MKQRMYILVPYNISQIQMGIQSLHAVVEYANKYSDTPEYKQWAEQDKTVIVLNGGTSNSTTLPDGSFKGSLNNCLKLLEDNNIPVASFIEEDINDALTGVAVLADERVWDRFTYPERDIFLRNLSDENLPLDELSEDKIMVKWIESIGGYKNFTLRELLGNKPLAR